MQDEKLSTNRDLKYFLYEEINNGEVGDITTKFVGYLLSFVRIELETLENQLISKNKTASKNDEVDYQVIDLLNQLNSVIESFLRTENLYYDEITNFTEKQRIEYDYGEIKKLFNYILELIDRIKKINFYLP
ncbi:hypothetical protein [Faecalibacillus intestinalis]|uniref:hypothetical protein n=1 Tax=Faecalibacillus intestinalis TaxID=1982626 RepID=UPI00351FA73C